MTKLYINTDVNLTFTIGEGLTIDDIVSMTVTLTKSGADTGTTLSGDNVIIEESSITVRIPDTDGIELPGVYFIKALFTDADGNIRGLTPTPEMLTFYS